MSPDTLSLAGKVAIITGSGRENGIGAAIAVALARNGAAVTINHVSDSSAPRAEAIASNIRKEGGKAIVIQANVDEVGARKLADGTIEAFGGIDILGICSFLFCFLLSCPPPTPPIQYYRQLTPCCQSTTQEQA